MDKYTKEVVSQIVKREINSIGELSLAEIEVIINRLVLLTYNME